MSRVGVWTDLDSDNTDVGRASILSSIFDGNDCVDLLPLMYGLRIFLGGEDGVFKTNSTESSSFFGFDTNSALLLVVGLP